MYIYSFFGESLVLKHHQTSSVEETRVAFVWIERCEWQSFQHGITLSHSLFEGFPSRQFVSAIAAHCRTKLTHVGKWCVWELGMTETT